MERQVRYPLLKQHGYSMLEMLVVAAIIGILATMPIASLRGARVMANEVEALAALNMMAVAYESYNNQSRPHRYPQYLGTGIVYPELIDYRTAEEIWDDFIWRSLVPRRFSGHPHDEENLLAKGYKLSIFAFRMSPSFSASPRYNYAIAMVPYEGSQQKRIIAIFQGDNDGWRRISPRARKIPGTGDLSGAKFYTWKDF